MKLILLGVCIGFLCTSEARTEQKRQANRDIFYCKYETMMTQEEAGDLCESRGQRLARVYTSTESQWILGLGLGPSLNYWFDLKQVTPGNFEYSDGSKPSIAPWTPGKLALKKRKCTVYLKSGKPYLWSDDDCNKNYATLCESDFPCGGPEVDREVYFCKHETKVNSQAAASLCRDKGGRLAKVYSDAEHKKVLALPLVQTQRYWFDLNMIRVGRFEFSDGTYPVFWPWAPGRPSKAQEICAIYRKAGKTFFWDNIVCNLQYGTICEYDGPCMNSG